MQNLHTVRIIHKPSTTKIMARTMASPIIQRRKCMHNTVPVITHNHQLSVVHLLLLLRPRLRPPRTSTDTTALPPATSVGTAPRPRLASMLNRSSPALLFVLWGSGSVEAGRNFAFLLPNANTCSIYVFLLLTIDNVLRGIMYTV